MVGVPVTYGNYTVFPINTSAINSLFPSPVFDQSQPCLPLPSTLLSSVQLLHKFLLRCKACLYPLLLVCGIVHNHYILLIAQFTDVDQDELNSDADDVQSLPDGIDSSPIPASPTSPSQSLESTATTAAAAVADELMLAGEMPAATIEPDTPAGLPAMTPGAAGLGMEPTAVVQGPWYMISTGRAVGVYRGW